MNHLLFQACNALAPERECCNISFPSSFAGYNTVGWIHLLPCPCVDLMMSWEAEGDKVQNLASLNTAMSPLQATICINRNSWNLELQLLLFLTFFFLFLSLLLLYIVPSSLDLSFLLWNWPSHFCVPPHKADQNVGCSESKLIPRY
jgi:hypothetical protein